MGNVQVADGTERIDEAEESTEQLEMRAAGVDEQKLVRKLDMHLLPLVMMLYLFSFLDRVNIGNARLYGLEADLGLTPSQFQVAVSVFFVPYLLLEVPSNLVLQRLRPHRWLAALSLTWGVVAALSGLVARSYAALLACRLLLGALEAGLFPGLTVYLTLFYTRRELARRVGYLFVSAAAAGALGGLLAFGIGKLDGAAGMRGWRWILLVEGLPSVVLGVAAWAWLPGGVATARFLDGGERARMELRRRGEYGETRSGRVLSGRDVRAAFADWKVWAFCAAQFGVDTMLYGYSTFLPTIIKGLGRWSPAQVQLLTMPCYFVGAAAYMLAATGSDRAGSRGPWCVGFGAVSVVGYAVLLAAGGAPAGVRYFACFLVAAGLYVVVGLPLAWLPNNCPRYGKRTTATGLQLTIGNAAGIMSSFLYPTTEGPRFVRGHAVTLAMVAVGTVIYGLMWAWYRRENRRRGPGGAAEREEHKGMSDEELQELGDESPHFKFTT